MRTGDTKHEVKTATRAATCAATRGSSLRELSMLPLYKYQNMNQNRHHTLIVTSDTQFLEHRMLPTNFISFQSGVSQGLNLHRMFPLRFKIHARSQRLSFGKDIMFVPHGPCLWFALPPVLLLFVRGRRIYSRYAYAIPADKETCYDNGCFWSGEAMHMYMGVCVRVCAHKHTQTYK